MDKEKICEVLNEIRCYCDNKDSCQGCIFNESADPSLCFLNEIPQDWPVFKVRPIEKGIKYV